MCVYIYILLFAGVEEKTYNYNILKDIIFS